MAGHQIPPISGQSTVHVSNPSAITKMGNHSVCDTKVLGDGFAGIDGKMSPQLNSKGKSFTSGSPVETTVHLSKGIWSKKSA